MTNHRRGYELEAELVKLAHLHDLPAERVRSKGGGLNEYDVLVDGLRVECKRRKRLPRVITEGFQHDPDAVVFRQDGSRKAWIVFPLDDWMLDRKER